MRLIKRGYHPIRLMTSMLDTYYINKNEKELLLNIRLLRTFIKDLIRERQVDTRNENGDFLSILIQDDLFKDNVELMTDESLLFLIAATQTTSTMVTECLFRMT